jgi:peptidylprolyl isomerase
VRRPTTVRGGIAAATILVLGLGALTACTGNSTPPTPTSTATSAPTATATAPATASAADVAALAAVKVTGNPGTQPKVALPSKPFTVGGAVARTLDQGTGNAVQKGDLVTLQIVEVSGFDGSELGNTWTEATPLITLASDSSLNQQVYDELLTARVGARIIVAATQSSSGLPLTVVDVVDVLATQPIPSRAAGTAVPPVATLPAVSLDANGKPSLAASKGTAPTSLVVQPLIQGTGPAVANGQTLVVHYTGWLWDGTKFDSTWDGGVPYVVSHIGQNQVIKGWDQGLVGQKVGSQVLLVVPPDLGYGADGQGAIPANATLVFVVDILAAK